MGASESKLTFKEDVFRLAREDNIAANDPWWAQFYQLPETSDDVFALWSPNDVRSLTQTKEQPPTAGRFREPKKNLETLIYTIIARLIALSSGRGFADTNTSICPEILNCVRILTRVLPYVYEDENLDAWEDQFFWQPRRPQRIWDGNKNQYGPEFDGLYPSRLVKKPRDGEETAEHTLDKPLGEVLVDLLLQLLFFPGFTIPPKIEKDGRPAFRPFYHIWNSGVGARQSAGMSKDNERNASEVVNLLITLASRQLYIQPHAVVSCDVKALTHLATHCDRQVALTLICSLLNTVVKYNPASWRIPVDLTNSGDSKARLVNLSLELLLILLLYPVPNGEVNVFRKNLGRLHRAEDFQFISSGLLTILTQPISSVTYQLGLNKQVPWAPDSLVLFWELLQINKRFRAFVVETDRAHDFLVLIMYYTMTYKLEASTLGLVRMCIFITQTLSMEPAFGKGLKKPFLGHDSLPPVVRIKNFHGNDADFLLTTIHSLMTNSLGKFDSLYPSLLAIMNNIAPYLQDLGRATTSKLMELYTAFSSPGFLLEKESNHQLLASLLQALNTILEHQYEANPRLIDAIVRNRQKFQTLRNFTIDGALAELERLAQERKERGVDGTSSPRRTSVDAATRDVRSPTTTTSISLESLPEHEAFAIGDDDDDDENCYDGNEEGSKHQQHQWKSTPVTDGNGSSAGIRSLPTGATPNTRISSDMDFDPSVPTQSRSMSEKARGKQPMNQASFSRSTSRNNSTSHLPTLSSISSHAASTFIPTQAWLDQWLAFLPLNAILIVIEDALKPHVSDNDDQPGKRPPLRTSLSEGGQRVPLVDAPSDPHYAVVRNRPISLIPGEPKLQAFQWTAMSMGWYLSLLWGLVYASDTSTNKGVNGIWTGTGIKLFNIASRNESISLRRPMGAVDAVGNTIVQRLGNFSFNTPSTNSPITREV